MIKTSKMYIKNFWQKIEQTFQEKSVARTLLQFLLIIVIGSFLSSKLSSMNATQARNADLFHIRITEQKKFIDKFTIEANRRMFLMQLVYWELTLHNEINDYRQDELKKKYDDYYDELIDWNVLLHYHLTSMEYHFPSSESMVHEIITEKKLNPLPVNLSLRALASDVLQNKYSKLHRELKKAKDKRLEKHEKLTEKEINIINAKYKELHSIVYHYLELLFRLSVTSSIISSHSID